MNITALDDGDTEFLVKTFVKALPKNLARRQTFRSAEFFMREVEFYNKIWPEFQNLQRRHHVMDPYDDVPKCLAAFQDGENDFIVMEDLGVDGFRSADRQVEMDDVHCQMALQCLGKLHGLSHAMRALEPESFARLTSHMVDIYYAEPARDWYAEIATLQISVARDAVHKEYPGSPAEERMHRFTKNTTDYYSEMIGLTHTVNEYAVIGHGDCWLPNFMFIENEDGSPRRLKLIDFQLVRLGSCALDISFFLYSCTTEQLRKDHYEHMLEWYYEGVEQVLQGFNLAPEKVFPRSILKEEMQQFARFGVGMAMESLPLSIMDEEDTTDLDAIEGTRPMTLPEVWKLKPIKSKEGRRRLADVFKHAVEQNFL